LPLAHGIVEHDEDPPAGQAAAEGTCGRLQGRWDLVTGSAEGTQELV
jgi:hypothetical protein